MRYRLSLFITPLLWSLSFYPVCYLSLSSAIAKPKVALEQLFASHEGARFVAVNGSDDNPGTTGRPWRTINHAAEQAEAGEIVVIRGGRYMLPAQVRLRNSGRSNAWITFIGYPGEKPVLDAQNVQRASFAQGPLNEGAFQIENVSYIRVANLTVINSPDAGFTVRDSSHIDLINNSAKGTASSGIAVWDTNHDDKGTEHIRIIGNTITKATIWDLAPPGMPRGGEPPHEALSIGGAVDFEVAYNLVYDSDKEGIDIKETSKRGKVHHNLVHHVARQGIYVDAWFGELNDVEIFSNVVHDCHGAGVVLSAENGKSVDRIDIHSNLIFNNDGSGLLFSRWGVDHARSNIRIANNILYHNGYGTPSAGQTYYWLTGGLYLYSANLQNIAVEKNVFSGNRGFQIGYSDLYLRDGRTWQEVKQSKQIQIAKNLIDGRNTIESPIESGGQPADQVKIYATNGDYPIFGDPLFNDPTNQDFSVRRASLAAPLMTSADTRASTWWKGEFPPRLVSIRIRN
jgi:hypothetical protein